MFSYIYSLILGFKPTTQLLFIKYYKWKSVMTVIWHATTYKLTNRVTSR